MVDPDYIAVHPVSDDVSSSSHFLTHFQPTLSVQTDTLGEQRALVGLLSHEYSILNAYTIGFSLANQSPSARLN
jgi:hypothetical protein